MNDAQKLLRVLREDADDIIASAHAEFERMADREYTARKEWAIKMGDSDPGERMRLPWTFSATKAADYIVRYFKDWKKVFKSKQDLLAAIRNENRASGRGSITVQYNAGRKTENGVGFRPIGYDKYRREDIETWIASLIAGK